MQSREKKRKRDEKRLHKLEALGSERTKEQVRERKLIKGREYARVTRQRFKDKIKAKENKINELENEEGELIEQIKQLKEEKSVLTEQRDACIRLITEAPRLKEELQVELLRFYGDKTSFVTFFYHQANQDLLKQNDDQSYSDDARKVVNQSLS